MYLIQYNYYGIYSAGLLIVSTITVHYHNSVTLHIAATTAKIKRERDMFNFSELPPGRSVGDSQPLGYEGVPSAPVLHKSVQQMDRQSVLWFSSKHPFSLEDISAQPLEKDLIWFSAGSMKELIRMASFLL